ncbi:Efflux pump vrtL, partial [Pseudocercospora fuligena]
MNKSFAQRDTVALYEQQHIGDDEQQRARNHVRHLLAQDKSDDEENLRPPPLHPSLSHIESDDLDLERGKTSPQPSEQDPNIVTWDGPNDQANPKNWSFKRRWLATGLVSLVTFMTPIASSMIAPAEDAIARDLHIDSQFILSLIFSIFLLAFAIGPFFLAPCSELFGRVIVLQLANVWFLVFNLVCGFAKTEGQMLAFRFLAGLGACAPQTIGGGVLGDLWRSEERGMATALYTVAPIVSPALGPLIGAWITEKTTWRKETGNQNLHTQYELQDRHWKKIWKNALTRPIILLFTQPIVMFLAAHMSLLYGIIYLMLATFPTLWTSPEYYNESIGIGGLNYLSLMIGMTAGAQIAGRVLDRAYRRLSARSPNKKGRPEFRVPILFPATILVSGGLFMYGWSAQAHTHWIVPNIGALIFGLGTVCCFTALQNFTIDAYTVYAASAVGTTAVARSLTGFGFPLFAPAMYSKLGWGWGNSVLGFASLAIGLTGASVLWFYGERLRARSPFAASTSD